jgi:hypothetical protein
MAKQKYNPLIKHGFQEVSGGGAVEYPTGIWTNFQDNIFATTTNVFNNEVQGVVVEIKAKATTNKVRIRVQTANAGQSAVAGIYKFNGTLFELVGQAIGTFDLGVAAVQELSYAANLELEPGIYAPVIHMSANTTIEAISLNAAKNVFGYANTMGVTSYKNMLRVAGAYTGTLPATLANNVIPSSLVSQILHNII